MKKTTFTHLFLSLLVCLILTNCTKKESVDPANTTKTTLEVNSWTIDGKLYKLSAYGFGWASTDFSPRAGWTFYSNTEKSSVEVSFLTKPVPAGTHTIENYADVHLNKVRDTKITGNKVGILATLNNNTYQSVAGKGTISVSTTKEKTSIVFKDIVLKDILSTKTITVSSNLEYTN
jgi:hypothetical protein